MASILDPAKASVRAALVACALELAAKNLVTLDACSSPPGWRVSSKWDSGSGINTAAWELIQRLAPIAGLRVSIGAQSTLSVVVPDALWQLNADAVRFAEAGLVSLYEMEGAWVSVRKCCPSALPKAQ